jgi:hypothetical protein
LLEPFVAKIRAIADRAGSESKLEGELNQVLKEVLIKYEISYDPIVNESLKALSTNKLVLRDRTGIFTERLPNIPQNFFGCT